MSEQKVFINYCPEDRIVAEKIRDWLTAEGIVCAMLTEVDSLEAHFRVVAQVEDTIKAKGALVVVLSKAALKSCWLISNAQYSCELAARRPVLVVYQIEDLPQDHPLALYYAQATVIYASKKGADPSTRLVNTVKRVLANTDAPKAFRPRHLPKRLLRWMVGIVAVLAVVLGVGSYFLPIFLAPSAQEPLAIPTPVVVFEEPFKGESVDQGIIVDRRYVPDFVPSGNPQEDAPFFFEPPVVHKRFSFDDPAHDNIDVLNLNAAYSSIAVSLKDQNAIRQTNGSLQIAMAPNGAQNMTEFGFGFPHLVSTETFEYLGMRFFIEPYQGWSDVNLRNQAGFGFTHQLMPLLMIDLSRQKIEMSNGEVFGAGPGWHTLEVLADPLTHAFDVYLDGEWVNQSSVVTGLNSFAQFYMFLSVRHATEWVNFYIDELVYGGAQPLTTAAESEDALYKITPDEVLYFNTFDIESFDGLITDGFPFVRLLAGKIAFDFPAAIDGNRVVMSVPSGPVNEVNYFAMKYRFTEAQEDPWSKWGELSIQLNFLEKMEDQEWTISVSEIRYRADYYFTFGKNKIHGWRGSMENFQPGSWHTMEMVIKPSTLEADAFVLQFWHDGCLVGEQPIDDIEDYLGEHPLRVDFVIEAGRYRQQIFSGEIDDITVGFIEFPGLEKGANHESEE